MTDRKTLKTFVSLGHAIDPDDFCFVPEGEILHEGIVVCCNSHYCGCNRAFGGIETHKATTVAKVAEVELDRDDLFDLAGKEGRAMGWGGEVMLDRLKAAAKAAEQFPVGTVVRTNYNFDTDEWDYEEVKGK